MYQRQCMTEGTSSKNSYGHILPNCAPIFRFMGLCDGLSNACISVIERINNKNNQETYRYDTSVSLLRQQTPLKLSRQRTSNPRHGLEQDTARTASVALSPRAQCCRSAVTEENTQAESLPVFLKLLQVFRFSHLTSACN
jgi:hypothetical protein